MRTSITNLFVAALTIVTLSTSAVAAKDVNQKSVTVLNQVKNINKLIVSGNVEVILVQSPIESVKVYDSYYSKNALVQEEYGVLRISSFQKETLTVAVYVRNLSTIEASNTSSVKTVGKVNFLSLDITLHDKAIADINANTIELNTVVKDNANLKLSGAADEHYAVIGSEAKLSMDKFVAACGSVKASNPVVAKVINQTLLNMLPVSDDFVEISK